MNVKHLLSVVLLMIVSFVLPPCIYGQHPGDEEAAEVARADAELNTVYKQVMSTLDQSQQTRLREEERAWLKNLDEEAVRLGREGGATGGSALRVDLLNARAKLIRERTQALRNSQPRARRGPIAAEGVVGGNPNGMKREAVAAGAQSSYGPFTKILRSTKEFSQTNFRGLYLGVTASQVLQFYAENSLHVGGNQGSTQEYSVPGVIPPQKFNSGLFASNGRTDANFLQVACGFASPVPGKRDEPTLVRMIVDTRFGAGVTLDEMRSDLDKKFGKENPGGVDQEFKILRWTRKTEEGFQIQIEAKLFPAAPGALYGTFHLEIDSDDLITAMRESFEQAFKELDDSRKKDTTKPAL